MKFLPLLTVVCLSFACDGRSVAKQNYPTENPIQISESAININTASAAELVNLPQVGERTAEEIIRHRERFGRFRKPEHLLLVRGISDERLRGIRRLIKVE